jgi:hypothetical protein
MLDQALGQDGSGHVLDVSNRVVSDGYHDSARGDNAPIKDLAIVRLSGGGWSGNEVTAVAFGRRSFLTGSLLAGAALIEGSSLLGAAVIPAAANTGPHERALRDARLVWQRLPTSWQDAALLGNGSLTAQVHFTGQANAICFAIGTAGKPIESPTTRLNLVLTGAPTSAHWQLDLWNAELTGSVTTTQGAITFSAFVPHDHDVVLVSIREPGGETRLLAVAAERSALQPVHGNDLATLTAAHRRWWNAYYTNSFLSIPDKSAQRFYWAQLYHAASIHPAGRTAGTEHPLVNGANHIELAGSAKPKFGFRAPDIAYPGRGSRGGRASNAVAAWRLPVIWTGYQHTMNPDVLREVLHPGLRKAVDFYAGAVTKDANGMLHLPLTRSPDYADVVDCTYDLSLVRWASTRLIESSRLLGVDEPRLATWLDLADRLAPYHVDAQGTLIGAGVRLAKSHPHPSHLQWLRLGSGTAQLARRSFTHWASMRGAWHGSSYVAAALMATTLRWPSAAHQHLTHFLGRDATPNTLYQERSRANQDVPLDAAQVLIESVVDSGNGWLEALPAVPSTWRDVSFAALRTRGAFLLDGARSAGRTDWVRVRGGTGQPVVLRHGISGPIDVRDQRGRRSPWQPGGEGAIRLCLADGESAIVIRQGADVDATEPEVRDVPPDGNAARWGLATAI